MHMVERRCIELNSFYFSLQLAAMTFSTQLARINLPPLDLTDLDRIRAEVHRFTRQQNLSVKLKSGRAPSNVNSAVMYAYCCMHP